MDHTQKTELLEQAYIDSHWENHKNKIINTPDWSQIITPGGQHSSANCVLRTRLSKGDVAIKIDQTVEMYEKLKVPYRWLVTPSTRPKDLEKFLLKKGLSLLYEASGMMSSIRDQIKSYSSEIRVVQTSIQSLDTYIETFGRCWELPHHQIDEFKADSLFALSNSPDRFLPFVAYFEGKPVGTSALLNIPSGGYLAAGTVDKKYRGRGIYKAMVSHRAKVAKEYGNTNVFIHAKKLTSAPICERLGFESVYDYKVFSRENPL